MTIEYIKPMDKIYLASGFSNSVKMRHYKQILEAMGFTITSRWIDYDQRPAKNGDWEELYRRISVKDLYDVEECDIIIVDALKPSTRGGYNTELGYGYAINKHIIVIHEDNDLSNVFFYLPGIVLVNNWNEAFVELTKMQDQLAKIGKYVVNV